MIEYYDAVLGLIPAALIGLTSLLSLIGVSTTIAVLAASLVTAGIIGHAMFVRGPTANLTDSTGRASRSRGLSAD